MDLFRYKGKKYKRGYEKKVKANEKLLIRFLESSDTNFVIPLYL